MGLVVLMKKKCQSLAKSAEILLIMSDRTDKFHELLTFSLEKGWPGKGRLLYNNLYFVYQYRFLYQTSLLSDVNHKLT
jgi:hypothetical protein